MTDDLSQAPIGRSDLTLTDIVESKNYTCVAYSDLASIEATAEVKVKGEKYVLRIFFIFNQDNARLLRAFSRDHYLKSVVWSVNTR